MLVFILFCLIIVSVVSVIILFRKVRLLERWQRDLISLCQPSYREVHYE